MPYYHSKELTRVCLVFIELFLVFSPTYGSWERNKLLMIILCSLFKRNYILSHYWFVKNVQIFTRWISKHILTFWYIVPVWTEEFVLSCLNKLKQLCLFTIWTPEWREATEENVRDNTNGPHVYLQTITWKKTQMYLNVYVIKLYI